LLLSLVFARIYISQSSVKTHLPCGEIYNNHLLHMSAECDSKIFLKIGQ